MISSVFIKRLMVWATLLLALVVILGFTGQVFAPGNSLAVIRWPVGWMLLVFGGILWLQSLAKPALAALTSGGIALGSIWVTAWDDMQPCRVQPCLTLYQKNLLSRAWPRYPLADDIVATDAHIVTLQEVSNHNKRFMSNAYAHYPFQIVCPFRPQQSVAVLTRLPVVPDTAFCLDGAGMAAVQVQTRQGQTFWAVSLHLEWPFPNDQFREAHVITEQLRALDGPIVIGGDFNMVPWGGSVRMIGQSTGTKPFGPRWNTHRFGSWVLPLQIDNVLLPDGSEGEIERRTYMGSDHQGLLTRFMLP